MQKEDYYGSDLEKEYSKLVEYFGEENVKFEYFNRDVNSIDENNIEEVLSTLFTQIKLTHIPSGKVVLGTEFNTQIENSISAMKDLKNLLG